MLIAEAKVATERPGRYLVQRCEHGPLPGPPFMADQRAKVPGTVVIPAAAPFGLLRIIRPASLGCGLMRRRRGSLASWRRRVPPLRTFPRGWRRR
jgi:hypothetical protein